MDISLPLNIDHLLIHALALLFELSINMGDTIELSLQLLLVCISPAKAHREVENVLKFLCLI